MQVGLDGTGKSTTVQLAAYLADCELYKLILTRGYNLSDFRDDIKKVCRMAGVRGISTVFLLTDADIAKVFFSFKSNAVCLFLILLCRNVISWFLLHRNLSWKM